MSLTSQTQQPVKRKQQSLNDENCNDSSASCTEENNEVMKMTVRAGPSEFKCCSERGRKAVALSLPRQVKIRVCSSGILLCKSLNPDSFRSGFPLKPSGFQTVLRASWRSLKVLLFLDHYRHFFRGIHKTTLGRLFVGEWPNSAY